MRAPCRVMLATLLFALLTLFAPIGSAPAVHATAAHVYGIFGPGGTELPTASHLSDERQAGVKLFSIELSWHDLQPDYADQALSPTPLSNFQEKIDYYRTNAPGSQFVVDLGLQYPPSWALTQDQLTDQYGNHPPLLNVTNLYWSTEAGGLRDEATNYIEQVFETLNF